MITWRHGVRLRLFHRLQRIISFPSANGIHKLISKTQCSKKRFAVGNGNENTCMTLHRLTNDVITSDVDRDFSTAHCESSPEEASPICPVIFGLFVDIWWMRYFLESSLSTYKNLIQFTCPISIPLTMAANFSLFISLLSYYCEMCLVKTFVNGI